VASSRPFNYSNAGYSIAALMLEKVSGKSWEQLIDVILTKKLKIPVYIGWPNKKDPYQPYGHWSNGDEVISLPPEHDYYLDLIEPAGDISMRIADYTRFIQLHLQGLSNKKNLLKADTYQYVFNCCKEYALGWGNFQKEKVIISEHAGSAGTFFCYTQIDRNKGIAYVVMVNSGTNDAQKGVFAMIKMLKEKFGSLK
jgi:CubicO group peptidase (beta-lactamase class C family)